MRTKLDAKMGLSQYSYDALGRLQLDQDAAGGSISMTRVDAQSGFTVTQASALGIAASYRTAPKPDGSFSRSNTFPGGLVSSLNFTAQGVTTTTAPDGTKTSTTQIADPEFGMLSPTVSVTTTLP